MFLSTIIGNLGSDAEFKSKDGKEFVTFSIAVNDRWKDAQGQEHEESQWISCILQGRNENLLPYLVRGASVCVLGRTKARLYSSPKEKAMKAGVNLDVVRIELIGRKPDEIPSMLYDMNGVGHNVYKAYYVAAQEVTGIPDGVLLTARNEKFVIDKNGFVSKVKEEVNAGQETSETQSDSSQGTNEKDNGNLPF